MTRTTTERPWSIPVSVHEVPETGRSFVVTADENIRAATAILAGLRALPRLEARFDVAPYGRDGLQVTGRVFATVGQVCVVTLEPIENEVDETIELQFTPVAAPPIAEMDKAEVDIVDVDAPEPLIGGSIDLGAIATDFMIMGIDPYPRKADAVFEPPAAGEVSGGPFAVLAALKKAGDRDSNSN
jgi:hypothetical protein